MKKIITNGQKKEILIKKGHNHIFPNNIYKPPEMEKNSLYIYTYYSMNSYHSPLEQFFDRLIKAIKLSLLSFFSFYVKKYNTRKKILIQKIIEKRKNSALLIQKKFQILLIRKDLFSLAKKHKDYYSIYPTINNKNKEIKIKIYTDLTNSKKYTILPVRFCLLRNCYVFDIPKNKFPDYKKIMRFNFILNDRIIIDPNYKKVLFRDKYVNEIDFKSLYKKYKKDKLLKYNKKYSKESSFISDSEEDEEDDYKNLGPKNNKKKLYNKTITNFNKYIKGNKLENDLTNSTMSTKGSSHFITERNKRKGSILKQSHSLKMLKIRKRVTFGIVKFSY